MTTPRFLPTLLLSAAAFLSGCGVPPEDREYPIAPGRYYPEAAVLAKGRDSSLYNDFNADGTYYMAVRTSPDCIHRDAKGTWYVYEGELRKRPLQERFAGHNEGCVDDTYGWVRENRTMFYMNIKEVTETSFSVCDHARDCTRQDQWTRWIQ